MLDKRMTSCQRKQSWLEDVGCIVFFSFFKGGRLIKVANDNGRRHNLFFNTFIKVKVWSM